MGFNMSLEFSPLDVPADEYAKITKVWEKSARGDPNHPQHLHRDCIYSRSIFSEQ